MNYVFGCTSVAKDALKVYVRQAAVERAGNMAAAVAAAADAYIDAMPEPAKGELIACNIQGNDDGLQEGADRSCGAPMRINVSYVEAPATPAEIAEGEKT